MAMSASMNWMPWNARDGLVERPALPRVADGRVESGLGDAHRLRADRRPRLLERAHRDLKPSPSSPRRFSTGTSQSVKCSATVGEPWMPSFFSCLPDAEPLHAGLDEERGDALGAPGARG